MNDGPDMPRRVQIEWAKEVALLAIDRILYYPDELTENIALDDEMEILKQRNRIAKFLGLPKRKSLAMEKQL